MFPVKMPDAQTVTAGSTSTIKPPLGNSYDRFDIYLTAGGTPAAVALANWGTYVGEIRLIVNGTVTWRMDAADLVKYNSWHGPQYMDDLEDGVLPIYLAQPWARTAGGEKSGRYKTMGLDTFTMEIDLKSGQTFGELAVYAEQSAPAAWSSHTRMTKVSTSFASTGEFEHSDYNKGAFNLMGLHITDANIGKLEVEADATKVHETTAAIRKSRDRIAGRVPQAGMTHVDFVHDRLVGSALPMMLNDFRTKLNFSTAPNSFSVYADTFIPQ